MTFIVDTNVVVALLDQDEVVSEKMRSLTGPNVISIVTQVELIGGVHARLDKPYRGAALAIFLNQTEVLEFDGLCARAYDQILKTTGFSRRKVLDRMIAAQALVHRATLVTLNGDDFRDVPGLELLEW